MSSKPPSNRPVRPRSRLNFLASTASAAPIAIDFGRRTARMLQLAKGSSTYSCVAGAELGGWALGGSEGAQAPPEFAATIKTTLAQAGFLGSACSLTLPAEMFQCDTARLPAMADSELKQSVEFEAGDRFGIDKATTVIGFLRLGEVLAGQQDVLVMAVPRTAVDACVSPIRSAGLAAVHLEHAAFAALRAIVRQRRSEIADIAEAHNFALVHLEDRVATLIVVRDGAPAMVRSVLGDWAPANTAVQRTGVQPGAPTQVPNQAVAHVVTGDTAISLEGDAAQLAEVGNVTDTQNHTAWRWGSLAEESLRCFRHLERTLNGWWPTRVVITGPAGADPQAVASMESVCDIVTELAVPIRMIEDPAPCVHGNRWIAAIGAAVGELPQLAAGKAAPASDREPAPVQEGAAA